MLIRLNAVEIFAFSRLKSVLPVELQFGRGNRILSRCVAVAPWTVRLAVARIHIVWILDRPYQLLHGMIQLEIQFGETGCDCLGARELELFNEIFMGNLRESPPLLRVQINIVHPQRGRY